MAAVMTVLATTVAATAQTLPDLKGTWSGPWHTLIYGDNPHHPGSATTADPPRIRDITFTCKFEGQDGRLVCCKCWSDPARKEPFAGTSAPDGKTISGVDLDGWFTFTVAAPERLDACYMHTGLSPARSIVANCGTLRRAGR